MSLSTRTMSETRERPALSDAMAKQISAIAERHYRRFRIDSSSTVHEIVGSACREVAQMIIQAERERCAKVVEGFASAIHHEEADAGEIAAAIRRGD